MMYFKQQSTDEEIDPFDFVGFAQDRGGTLWYFSEHSEQFTISEYGIFNEPNAEFLENLKPFTRFDGTITIGN